MSEHEEAALRALADFAASALFAEVEPELLAPLAAAITEIELPGGATLLREGEPGDAVFLLRTGRLEILIADGESHRHVDNEVEPGALVGEVQLISGGPRTATVRAQTPARLLRLPKAAFDALAATCPQLLRATIDAIATRRRRQQLPRALLAAFGDASPSLLAALEGDAAWRELGRGEQLFCAGEAGEDAFLVVSGELIVLSEHREPQLLGHIGRGELVGELALLAPGPRSATVRATRETWLVRLDRALFERATQARAQLLEVVEVLASRLRERGRVRPRRSVLALVPLSPRVALSPLVEQLRDALLGLGGVRVFDLAHARADAGLADPRQLAADSPEWMRLSLWLEIQRREHSFVVLLGAPGADAWNLRIAGEADLLLRVADVRDSPEVQIEERRLDERASGDDPSKLSLARNWLVLVHPSDTAQPTATALWLDPRRLDAHAHLRRDNPGDIARLARLLAGRGLGLALSGGGARGFAHAGVYEALCEAGLPVDSFAGVSAGAMCSTLLASGCDRQTFIARMGRSFGPRSRPFADVTVPMIALTRGRRLARCLRSLYGEQGLEDLWIPCTIMAASFTTGKAVALTRGPIWEAVLASMSPPGLVPPVRIGDELMFDGGLIDNLPVRALDPSRCARRMASYVGSEHPMRALRPLPGPWRLAWDRLIRRRPHAEIPSLGELMMRAMTLTGVDQLRQAQASAELSFEPPVSEFDMFDLSRPGPVIEAGYTYARERIAAEFTPAPGDA